MATQFVDVTEQKRLNEAREAGVPWKKWGPYLSERQWGTVREDYSENGDAWNYFTHDQARSRAYRWGEDGLAGISRRQAAALLRAGALERQGPDPQGAPVRADQQRRQPRRGREGVLLLPRQHADALVHEVPVQVPAGGVSLRATSSRRTARESREEFEYELLDTGVFDDDRYFDVFVEYAKAGPEDMLVRITVHNRGPEAARLHVLPTLWFRNTWSWDARRAPKPSAARSRAPGAIAGRAPRARRRTGSRATATRRAAVHRERDECGASLGPAERVPVRQGRVQRLRGRRASSDAVNPAQDGDQGGRPLSPRRAGGAAEIRLRLRLAAARTATMPFGSSSTDHSQTGIAEADEFYERITPPR